jgi:hypothetical protein
VTVAVVQAVARLRIGPQARLRLLTDRKGARLEVEKAAARSVVLQTQRQATPQTAANLNPGSG